MGRIIGIDYGEKRTGIAATDPLQIAVHPLGTWQTNEVIPFLKEYLSKEQVEKVVVGDPSEGNPNTIYLKNWQLFVSTLHKEFPLLLIDTQDETLSSSRAREIILKTIPGRKKRRDKQRIDKVSAVLILQDYLKHY